MTAQLTARQVGDVSIVDVAGRVTVAGGSNALRETLRELTSRGKKKILINLREVSYIDSSGIGELVSAYKEVTQGGGQLKLVGLSGQGAYQLLVTKSCTFFELYVDEGAAILSFG
jgi:anti-sigma B factor antagonist